MIVTEIKKDEDILLRLNELAMESYSEFKKEQHDQSLEDKQSDGGFRPKIDEENQEGLHEDASHSRYDIKEDEDIILRLNELAMESDPEFKKEQDDQSLADKERDGGGFEPKIEEENQKGLHEDASHSRYDIVEDEDIILRLNELAMESDPEFKKEQDDRSLADRESYGGVFKPKIEEENQKGLHEDASHSRYDIKEDEDIILRLYELTMESVRESVDAAIFKFKKEQNDLNGDWNDRRSLADEESDGGFKNEIKENAEDLHTDPSNSEYDIKKTLINKDLEESNSSEDCDGLQVRTNETLRSESREVKMTTEKVENPFDLVLGPLEELEKFVLKFYEFIDHTLPIWKDAHKVKFEVHDEYAFHEKVRYLLLASSRRVNSVIDELERMKNDENQEEEESSSPRKTQIPDIFIQLVEINAYFVERAFHHGIDFLLKDNCTEKELSACVEKLNRSRENLGIVLWRIRELKNKKMGTFQDSESTENSNELEMEDSYSIEESEKLKQRCAFNAYIAPQLPDGFER